MYRLLYFTIHHTILIPRAAQGRMYLTEIVVMAYPGIKTAELPMNPRRRSRRLKDPQE